MISRRRIFGLFGAVAVAPVLPAAAKEHPSAAKFYEEAAQIFVPSPITEYQIPVSDTLTAVLKMRNPLCVEADLTDAEKRAYYGYEWTSSTNR